MPKSSLMRHGVRTFPFDPMGCRPKLVARQHGRNHRQLEADGLSIPRRRGFGYGLPKASNTIHLRASSDWLASSTLNNPDRTQDRHPWGLALLRPTSTSVTPGFHPQLQPRDCHDAHQQLPNSGKMKYWLLKRPFASVQTVSRPRPS